MPKFRNRNEYVKWKAKIEEEIKIKVDHTPPEPQEPQEPTGVYNPTPQTRHIARTSFNDELSDVFTYPFQGEGRSLMIAGTLFISIIYLLNTSILLWVYLACYSHF